MCKFHKMQIISEGFLWAEWLFLQVIFSRGQSYRMKWPEVLRHARLSGMALVLFTNGNITWDNNIASHEKKDLVNVIQALRTIIKFHIILNLWSENNDPGLEIATDTVANATNIFPLATKNSGLVAKLATIFLYELDLN